MRKHNRGHLYRGKGTKQRELRQFEQRYGKTKGKRVYGAVIGEVKREQMNKKRYRNF